MGLKGVYITRKCFPDDCSREDFDLILFCEDDLYQCVLKTYIFKPKNVGSYNIQDKEHMHLTLMVKCNNYRFKTALPT